MAGVIMVKGVFRVMTGSDVLKWMVTGVLDLGVWQG